jgi:hypothetical protein
LHQVFLEPLPRELRHLVQSTGLFKQVRRPGDNHEFLFAAQLCECRPVQLDDLKIVAADNQ